MTKKQKRGRPALLTKEYRDFLKMHFPDGGKRTLQNRHYQQRTVNLLLALGNASEKIPEKFHFIFEGSDKRDSVFKVTILTELGRIQDDVDLLLAAEQICKHKLPTREAVAYIRRDIRGIELGASALGLFTHLSRALQDYEIKHADLTEEHIRRALGFFDVEER